MPPNRDNNILISIDSNYQRLKSWLLISQRISLELAAALQVLLCTQDASSPPFGSQGSWRPSGRSRRMASAKTASTTWSKRRLQSRGTFRISAQTVFQFSLMFFFTKGCQIQLHIFFTSVLNHAPTASHTLLGSKAGLI